LWNPEPTMQPESAPSVQATAEALRRLRLSEGIQEDVGFDHTYPLRDADLETVETFYEVYGELPPAGYLRRLWWWISGAGGEG
jgi:hypothetical protein